MPRIRIRKAKIDTALRTTLERYGVVGMQVVMGTHHQFYHEGKYCTAHDKPYMDDILQWLTEQFDRSQRWETLSMTMEVMITILVGIEVYHALFG